MIKTLLNDIIEAMDMQSDDYHFYLNNKTGEIISVSDSDSCFVDEELRNLVEESDDFIPIPDKFYINEWRVMEKFCLSVPGEVGDVLYNSIHGSGAFRRFKDNLDIYDLTDKWYSYRSSHYYKIAKIWCEANEIFFTDDIVN